MEPYNIQKNRVEEEDLKVDFGPQINKSIRVDHKTGEYFELGSLLLRLKAK